MIEQEIAAGRDLDALVCRQVMGGEVIGENNEWVAWPDRPDVFRDLPAYSTDIAAAWLVLDRFTSYDLSYEGEVNGETSCTVGYWPDSKYVYAKAVVQGDNAPLAICRAALQAVERAEAGG